MTIKTIAVSLNDIDNLDSFLPTVAGIANAHQAHVSGIYVVPSVEVYAAYAGMAMADVVDTQRKRYEEMAASVREKFDHMLDANGLQGDWRQLDAINMNVSGEFCSAARVADLAIVTKVDPDTYCGVEAEFMGNVIMGAGRPVMIVPRGRVFDTVGKRALVGWNATRESARAVFDAIPILQAGDSITLTWIDPQKNRDEAGDMPGAELAATLARHGLKVTAEPMPTAHGDVGEALLNKASDSNADLLVMGAYGHSRVREFVFGGASETVLKRAGLPVLMSH
ncbi:MAG: universal stress protein [Anderseniella sp.]|nr:universal stress protein [Anderseniella sp.]